MGCVYSVVSRPIRGPVAGRLVEVTTRTMQSRFLLRPGPEANAIIKGVIGRAQERYKMAICALVVLGNHWHALLLPENSRQLSSFMRYVNSVAEASASELSLAGARPSLLAVRGHVARKLGRLYN